MSARNSLSLRFIHRNVLHLTAKWNMILLKNDEIIDFW